MNCHSLRDAIVDLARGGDAGPGTLAAIESHLEHCASCAAMMARERQLSQGLRALAASTAADLPSDGLERRLGEIFASRHRAPAAIPTASNWWWTRAAAVLVVGVATAWWWYPGHESGKTDTPPVAAADAQRPSWLARQARD